MGAQGAKWWEVAAEVPLLAEVVTREDGGKRTIERKD